MRADARANRHRILVAADALFASQGLAVPLDEIARHAGLGPGTLHRHFPTKNGLVAAVALEHLEVLVAAAERRVGEDDPVAALRDQLTQMMTAGDHHAPLKQALAGSPADVAWSQTDVARRLRAALGDLLLRAQNLGAVSPDLSADHLIALIAGAYAAIQRAGIPAESPDGQRLTNITLTGLGLLDEVRPARAAG
jgi:AcrR family transcriptional regulator